MAAAKKMTQKEVKAPDEFLTSMGRVIEFLQLYGGWILAGAAAILLAIVAGVLLSRRHDTGLVERSLAFQKAFAPLMAVAETPADDQPQKKPEEVGAALAGAAQDLEKFAADHEGTPLARVAWITRGLALLGAGQAEAAFESVRKGLDGLSDASWRPITLEAAAAAADAAGKREEAEKYYAEMTRSGSRLFRAAGQMHLGDLYHPAGRVRDGEAADPKKAREFYEKGLAEIPADDSLLTPAERLFRQILKQRLATLD